MELSNSEQVVSLLDQLARGLRPFLERQLAIHYGEQWRDRIRPQTSGSSRARHDVDLGEVASLLSVMDRCWSDLFATGPLTRMERSYVNELRGWREEWAQGKSFTEEDVNRVRDNADRLLRAISASADCDRVFATVPMHATADHPLGRNPEVEPVLRAAPTGSGAQPQYLCLVCNAVSPHPSEPECTFRAINPDRYRAECGFTTRRWRIVNPDEASRFPSTKSFHAKKRMEVFGQLGGWYVFGCLAILLGILALIWVVGPLLLAMTGALREIF